MNKEKFFNNIRTSLFSGSLNQSQVDGLNAILAALNGLPIKQQAYCLATAYHETARTMQPIAEYGKGKNYDYGRWRVNSKNEKYCPKNGRRQEMYTFTECPNLFYGRGYVQLTWYSNYEKTGALLGVDLVNNPDMAMQPEIAAKIMRQGMVDGWFTGKKLSDYISNNKTDYTAARKIINGNDKANVIAEYAVKFEKALSS